MEGAAEAGQPLAGGRWSARYPSGTTGAGGRWSALGSAARIAAAATDHCSSGRSCRQDRERESGQFDQQWTGCWCWVCGAAATGAARTLLPLTTA